MTGREAAFHIIKIFNESTERLEDIVRIVLNKYDISARERRFTYNLSFGVVRNLNLLNWKAGLYFKGDYKKSSTEFKTILQLALFEIDFLEHIPPRASINEYVNLSKKYIKDKKHGIINGILRTYIREKGRYKPEKKFKSNATIFSVKYSFPEWMIKRWFALFGENETKTLCEAFNQRPVFSIRVNTKKTSVEEFGKKLLENKIVHFRSEYFDNIFKVTEIQKISALKWFDDGLCSVQDESAFMAAQLLNSGENELILDCCAAPGGKMTAIMEQQDTSGQVYGMDIAKERIRTVAENLKRLGFVTKKLLAGDAVRPPFGVRFDKIIADVPCSGLGTIRKNPDIKWRRSFKDLMIFQDLQYAILEKTAYLLKKGGTLVYSTCTIDILENEEIVKRFLENNKGQFVLKKPEKKFSDFISDEYFIKTMPQIHHMDGSFAAILKKL